MQGVAPAIGCPAGGAGGSGGSAGIGHRLSLLGLMGSVGAVSSVGLATFEAAGALAGQPVGAVGPSDDRPGPAGGLAARLSLFSSTTTLAPKVAYSCGGPPVMQLGRRPLPRGKGARVEGHKHRIQGRGSRPPAALASRGDRALPDRFGVVGGHPQPVPLEGFAQRWPGGAQHRRRGVDAAPAARSAQRRVRPRPGRRGSGWAASPEDVDRGSACVRGTADSVTVDWRISADRLSYRLCTEF
jgi:hypothetical protein